MPGRESVFVRRLVYCQLPGDLMRFALELPAGKQTFAGVQELMRIRQALRCSFLAVYDPAHDAWLQEADFEGGELPEWEPLELRVLLASESTAPPPQPPPPTTRERPQTGYIYKSSAPSAADPTEPLKASGRSLHFGAVKMRRRSSR